MTERYNDKTNPEVVMVAYMVPSVCHVAVARVFGVSPRCPLAGLLNRKAQAFHMIEVTQ
jgi:hypothetical protein